MPTVLVGTTGYARAGKDTVVRRLVMHGWQRRALADELRREVYEAILGERLPFFDKLHPAYESFSSFVSYLEENKGSPDGTEKTWVRQILQSWGMMRRDLEGPNYWINKIEPTKDTAVSDIRFPNEAEWLHENNGILIRVTRGAPNKDPHASEIHVPHLPADFEIENNGTIEELYAKIDEVIGQYV